MCGDSGQIKESNKIGDYEIEKLINMVRIEKAGIRPAFSISF